MDNNKKKFMEDKKNREMVAVTMIAASVYCIIMFVSGLPFVMSLVIAGGIAGVLALSWLPDVIDMEDNKNADPSCYMAESTFHTAFAWMFVAASVEMIVFIVCIMRGGSPAGDIIAVSMVASVFAVSAYINNKMAGRLLDYYDTTGNDAESDEPEDSTDYSCYTVSIVNNDDNNS